ncbi:MAG: hypothetical protein IPF99_35395 [Deltaproteobacteria bacterium]|nr:hypothetical protein [Deltaproteobacteria bacterium]
MAPFDNGGAGPFRAFDHRAPDFTPAGSGGFMAKYVALAMIPAVFATVVALGVLSAANGWSERELDGLIAPVVGPFVLVYLAPSSRGSYKSWEFLPPEMRRNASGRVFEPGAAVLANFIPIYGLYLDLRAELSGLCDAIDAALVQNGRPRRPRATLAVVCGVAQLIPFVNCLVRPVLWLTYMLLVDRAKRQLAPAR